MMYVAENGHLPVVEYLLERGADTETKDDVGIALSSFYEKPHIRHTCIAWTHSIDGCCMERSFTSG